MGVTKVIQHIKKVWSSTFNPRSIIARARLGLPLENDPIGVAVLKMVNAKAAGVMFTLNPVNGDPSVCVIEGNWGLGESVVSGAVTPDKWVVDKVILEIAQTTVAHKHKEFIFDPEAGKAALVDLTDDRQDKPCINNNEIIELVKVGKKLEKHYQTAQDMEWSVDKDLPFPDNVFLVQCRPEQVWNKKKKESMLGKKTGRDLIMQRAMYRIKL
jgi:pyruvate,water dikinase